MHTAIKVTLIVLLLLEVVAKILLVGKERRPYTSGDATFAFLFNGAFVAAILYWL